MTPTPDPLILAGDFPPADRSRWIDLVEGVIMKGRDSSPEAFATAFGRQLVSRTLDGLEIQPLYTAADAPGPDEVGLPGRSPFVRGATPVGGWDVRSRVDVDGDGTEAGRRALDELESGASSILLGLRSVPTIDIGLLDRVTAGVSLDLAPVVLDAGPRFPDAAEALFDLWSRRDVRRDQARAVLGADPIGEHARTGGGVELAPGLEAVATLAQRCAAAYPGVRPVVVDGSPYHEAGASDAEELAALLATGVAYLRVLTRARLPVEVACAQLEFRLAAVADQFLTVAKLRAARRLWDQVARHCGAAAPARAQRQHAVTSTAMMSRYDPWVNLLRTTVACFGAGVGGAEAITVLPHDDLRVPGGTELSRRMARNVSAVLAEESHLGRVADPAGGSWYVERLTADLAAAAWAAFQAIEATGGIVAALEAGAIAARIDTTWAARLERLAQRRDPLTGVSEFAAIDEEPPPPGLAGSTSGTAAAPGATAFPPLPRRRYAEPFEVLRGRSDAEAAAGPRPTVFLAALGTAAAFTARVTFTRNLFEVGGIRALVGAGATTPDAAAAAFTASGARLVCLCSSDAVYADLAAPTAAALRSAGAGRIYLAGRPGDQQAILEAAGVDEFVFAGSDVLEVLGRALDVALRPAGSVA